MLAPLRAFKLQHRVLLSGKLSWWWQLWQGGRRFTILDDGKCIKRNMIHWKLRLVDWIKMMMMMMMMILDQCVRLKIYQQCVCLMTDDIIFCWSFGTIPNHPLQPLPVDEMVWWLCSWLMLWTPVAGEHTWIPWIVSMENSRLNSWNFFPKRGTPWKINGWNLQPSPMKRKENDLNQTSMIMFHVNLQGCSAEAMSVPLHWTPDSGWTPFLHPYNQ